MSHFYAAIPTSARRTTPTARGHKSTGISTYAASHAGRVTTYLWHDEKTGEDRFEVYLAAHFGHGDHVAIASGVVGKASTVRKCAWDKNRHTAPIHIAQ